MTVLAAQEMAVVRYRSESWSNHILVAAVHAAIEDLSLSAQMRPIGHLHHSLIQSLIVELKTLSYFTELSHVEVIWLLLLR